MLDITNDVILHYITLYYTRVYYIVLCCIVLYFIMLYYVLLCYIMLYYTTLYYIILYCIILYYYISYDIIRIRFSLILCWSTQDRNLPRVPSWAIHSFLGGTNLAAARGPHCTVAVRRRMSQSFNIGTLRKSNIWSLGVKFWCFWKD